MTEMRKCQICKQNEAIWAVQIIAGEVTVYRVGWQMRGFYTEWVCDECLEAVKEKLEKEQK